MAETIYSASVKLLGANEIVERFMKTLNTENATMDGVLNAGAKEYLNKQLQNDRTMIKNALALTLKYLIDHPVFMDFIKDSIKKAIISSMHNDSMISFTGQTVRGSVTRVITNLLSTDRPSFDSLTISESIKTDHDVVTRLSDDVAIIKNAISPVTQPFTPTENAFVSSAINMVGDLIKFSDDDTLASTSIAALAKYMVQYAIKNETISDIIKADLIKLFIGTSIDVFSSTNCKTSSEYFDENFLGFDTTEADRLCFIRTDYTKAFSAIGKNISLKRENIAEAYGNGKFNNYVYKSIIHTISSELATVNHETIKDILHSREIMEHVKLTIARAFSRDDIAQLFCDNYMKDYINGIIKVKDSNDTIRNIFMEYLNKNIEDIHIKLIDTVYSMFADNEETATAIVNRFKSLEPLENDCEYDAVKRYVYERDVLDFIRDTAFEFIRTALVRTREHININAKRLLDEGCLEYEF